MKESNISRDHIAMEAMKELIAKAPIEVSIWERIRVMFGKEHKKVGIGFNEKLICRVAYEVADAMIEERIKNIKED